MEQLPSVQKDGILYLCAMILKDAPSTMLKKGVTKAQKRSYLDNSMYVCLKFHTYIHIHMHIHTHTCVHTYAWVSAHICACTDTGKGLLKRMITRCGSVH